MEIIANKNWKEMVSKIELSEVIIKLVPIAEFGRYGHGYS